MKRIKKVILTVTAMTALTLSSLPAKANDPCEITLCMYGKLVGGSGSSCSSEIKKYFNVISYGKHGISLSKTFKARESMLTGECPASYGVSSYITSIMSKFGRVLL